MRHVGGVTPRRKIRILVLLARSPKGLDVHTSNVVVIVVRRMRPWSYVESGTRDATLGQIGL